jgi:hypothetical protein
VDKPRSHLDAAAMLICWLANPSLKTKEQLSTYWNQALSMRTRATYRATALEVHSILTGGEEAEYKASEMAQSSAQAADPEPF